MMNSVLSQPCQLSLLGAAEYDYDAHEVQSAYATQDITSVKVPYGKSNGTMSTLTIAQEHFRE